MNFDLCISQNISMFPETNKSQFKKSPFWNKVRKKTETFRFSKEKLVLLMFNQKQSSTIYFLIVVDTITEKSLGFILDWTNCKFACFKETMIPTHIRLNKVFPSCEKKNRKQSITDYHAGFNCVLLDSIIACVALEKFHFNDIRTKPRTKHCN